MARLIDADKLFTWLVSSWRNKYPIGDGSQFDIVHIYEIKEEIDNAETVDAVPVEWLLNHIPHDEPMEAYNKKLIEYLVIAWRKENESSISV